MRNNINISLPGGAEQVKLLLNSCNIEDKAILVIGFGSEFLAKVLQEESLKEVYFIVDDEESLISSRLILSKEKQINARFMNFDRMDFTNAKFDIVYAQASISTKKRKKILNEIFRVLKPGGIFCGGEIISLTETTPRFILDIWDRSNISGITLNNLKDIYSKCGFRLVSEKDLSYTLRSFYSKSSETLKNKLDSLSDDEKKHNKKLINKISHETKAYLNQGGDKYIGFYSFVLKKDNE